MTTTRVEEINEAMLDQFKDSDIEDTTENRIMFLQGIQDAWKEDEDSSIEKSLYQMALSAEIFRLKMTSLLSLVEK